MQFDMNSECVLTIELDLIRGIGLAVARILLEKFQAQVIAFQLSTSPELKRLKEAHQDSLSIIEGDVWVELLLADAISLTSIAPGPPHLPIKRRSTLR